MKTMSLIYHLVRFFAYWAGFLLALGLLGGCIGGAVAAVITSVRAKKKPRPLSMTLVIIVGNLVIAAIIAVLMVWMYGSSIRS
jgi:uncharacterized membrane protein YsdA (DUF1294 family)